MADLFISTEILDELRWQANTPAAVVCMDKGTLTQLVATYDSATRPMRRRMLVEAREQAHEAFLNASQWAQHLAYQACSSPCHTAALARLYRARGRQIAAREALEDFDNGPRDEAREFHSGIVRNLMEAHR